MNAMGCKKKSINSCVNLSQNFEIFRKFISQKAAGKSSLEAAKSLKEG